MTRCLLQGWLVLLLPLMVGSAVAAPNAPSVRQTAEGIVLENATCRYVINHDGLNMSFGPPGGKNVCEPGHRCMVVRVKGKDCPANRVALSGRELTVAFADCAVTARVRLEARPENLALTVTAVQGGEVEWLQFCNLRLTLAESVGRVANAAWGEGYGACVQSCNDLTEAYGADYAQAHLCARCYPQYGLVGARVAIVGVPTGQSEPGAKLLDAVGRMEVAEGLPHPLINGVWIKQSPERFRSYLMVHDLSEANVDEVVAAAKGGFGCIEFYPWQSTASYRLSPTLFPHGMAGLKQVCDKIHAAGMQVGLHTMQTMIGWGAKDDPYMSPQADPRLLQDKRGVLATAVDEQATTIALQDGMKDWPARGEMLLEGEIIGYEKRTDATFESVQRGKFGTTVLAHPAGASVGNLVNCFAHWGDTVFCPDLKTDLADEICRRIADVFNAVGADMSYFDAGEELAVQPPTWRNQGTVALGVMKRLKKPVVLEGNDIYTNLSWHVITRGSPNYDPIKFGRREYTLRFKGTQPAYWARNLLTGDVGWFAPVGNSPAIDAVTPDEVMLLCLKAVGAKAPISFLISAAAVHDNPRLPEMLEVIRACDELKRKDYFGPSALMELTKERAECHLEQTPQGEWALRSMQFGPSQVANAADPDHASWQYHNPYPAQEPLVRLRARAKLARYGDPANYVLADFAQGPLFTADSTASPDLVQSIEVSAERTPDGAAALAYRVENKSVAVSKWAKLSYTLPVQRNLSDHRRLGLWVKANGAGGLLNVQLAGSFMRRDHYVPLDFTGWRYVELLSPDESQYWNYSWPYPWTDLYYTCRGIYEGTKRLELYVNAVPAGAKVECLIGRIEALEEIAAPVKSPALQVGGQTLSFPVALRPEEYVEMDFQGRCRQFGASGKLLSTVTPTGKLTLGEGENIVTFSCAGNDDASTRAEINLAVRGKRFANAKRPGVKGQTARYEGLTVPPK